MEKTISCAARWYTLLFPVVVLLLLAPGRMMGEVSVRECIHLHPTGDAYVLPADGQWHNIGHLEFSHQDASDYIVQASIFFPEGNTPDSRVEYQFLLDGVPHGWFTKRVPDSFPTSQSLRANIANVSSTPTQHHFLGLRARNLSTNPVYYNGFWITPFLVDSVESRGTNWSDVDITVGSTWTTILQAGVSVTSGHMLYLSSYVAIQSGIPQDTIEFRFTRDGFPLNQTFVDSVPDQFPDGLHLAYIDANPGSGIKTIRLQARAPSGLSVKFKHRELSAQEIPGNSSSLALVDVDPASVPKSIPNDGNWHSIGSVTLSTSPIAGGTDGSGFYHVMYSGSLDREAQVRLHMELPNIPFQTDIGWVDLHPTGRNLLGSVPSDWEVIGTNNQKVVFSLDARGLCHGATPNLQVSDARAQVLMLATKGYSFHPCTASPATCCANQAACEVYVCQPEGTGFFNPPSRDCFGN